MRLFHKHRWVPLPSNDGKAWIGIRCVDCGRKEPFHVPTTGPVKITKR